MNTDYPEKRRGLRGRIIFSLLLVVASAAATSALFLFHREPPASTVQQAPLVGTPGPVAPRLAARLYFATRNAEGLTEEVHDIEGQERLLDRMAQTLIELAKGPQTDALAVIPEGTTLNSVYMDDWGVAYVDFSSALVQNHPGGTCAEALTAYAVVNTLAASFPNVSAVQLLVDGAEIVTLAGHLDMSQPLLPDFSLVKTD